VKLDPQERATLYLHGIDDLEPAEIAIRQGVDASIIRRTLRSARKKLGATTNANAVLRAYVLGELDDADRSWLRRAPNGIGEQRAIDTERRKQRWYFKQAGIQHESFEYGEDDDD
jgi:DNA-binding CsgD family transcriptional regulator